MAASPLDISAREIEALLADGRRPLLFPHRIEARYDADMSASRRKHIVAYGLLAIVVFDLFIAFDFRLLPDVWGQSMLLRLGVVTPLALAATYVGWRARHSLTREALQAVMGMLALAAILFLSTSSQSPLAVYHHFGAMLVVIFTNVMQRLQLRYAALSSFGCLVLYCLALPNIAGLPPEAAVAAAMIMAGAIGLTLVANYRLERQLRTAYLFHLRDSIRHDELDQLSHIDPLTGLGNRRALERRLEGLWTGSVSGGSACLVLADVDFFKAYNDRYGHPAGDMCLKQVADILAAEFRGQGAEVFRYGGEEFVAIIEGPDLMQAVRLAESARKKIEQAALVHEAAGTSARIVTVSLGVAAALKGGSITKDELLVAADTALYAAKRNGRNQVWPPLGPARAPATVHRLKGTGASAYRA